MRGVDSATEAAVLLGLGRRNSVSTTYMGATRIRRGRQSTGVHAAVVSGYTVT